MKISDIVGINLHQAHDDDQVKVCMEELGFAHVYIDAKWHTIETAPGVYEWDWLDKAIDHVYKYPHYPPLLSLLPGVPAGIAPDDPRQKDGFLLFADERVQDPWREFLNAIFRRYSFIEEWGILTELNIKGWWLDSIDSFIEHLLAPAADIAHNTFGKQIISAGITAMDFDGHQNRRDYARECFRSILVNGKGMYDHPDMHSWAKNADLAAQQIFNWGGREWKDPVEVPGEQPRIKIFTDGFPKLWVSECGFSGTEEQQLASWQRFGELMVGTWPWIGRFYAYHGWENIMSPGGLVTSGLLKRENGKLMPKLAGQWISKEYLQ